MISLFDYILEKRTITFGGSSNPRFGQCIILAGGAASGKGFVQNRIDCDFKVFDVDELKKLYIKLAKKGVIQDTREYNLNNREDVSDLHKIVSDRKWKSKERELFDIQRRRSTESELKRLPNILFDMVSKDPDDVREILDMVYPIGYNVTLIWVACNMDTARVSNAVRGIGAPDKARSVPDDIIVSGHRGAYRTVVDILSNKYKDINERISHAWITFGTGWGRKMEPKFEKNCVIEVPKSGDDFKFNKAEVDAYLDEQQPIDYGFLKKKLNSSDPYDKERVERFIELTNADKSLIESAIESDRKPLIETEIMRKLYENNII